jgi:hypothetical protein
MILAQPMTYFFKIHFNITLPQFLQDFLEFPCQNLHSLIFLHAC